MLRTGAHDDPLSFADSLTADASSAHTLLLQLLAAYPHGLLVSDEAGVLVGCNRRSGELLGIDAQALLGQPFDVLVAGIAAAFEDPGRLRTYVATQRATQAEAAEPLELATSAESDALARRLLLGAAALGGRDVASFIAWTVIDASHAGACDAQVRALKAQLFESEKMAALGNLVAGIAHEINTPVGAIGSMHSTLRAALAKLRTALEQRLAKPLEEDAQLSRLISIVEEANRVVADGVERVTTLVGRLRSFARRDEEARVATNLEEALEDTLALLHHELKYGIEVVRDYAGLPVVDCYPGQLKQVFLNLLVNARQAIGKRKGRITVATRRVDDTVEISITDDGPGIAAEHLPRLFDAGFTTKGVAVGTGLGLAICQQLVARHGGSIEVESESCQGASFTVVLPWSPAPASRGPVTRGVAGCAFSAGAGRDPQTELR